MEALVAVAVFTVVFLSALALYQTANRAYLRTDAATIQQQNVRFAMDRMLETLRDAGAGYNTLGSAKLADEQIEGAWESAIFVRGNFNNAREGGLETTATTGFSIVTTGNDEIVGFVLRKPNANNRSIEIKADFTAPRSAVYTNQTTITNETIKRIPVAATTIAEQTDPPYQLTKVTFDTSGNPVYEVLADNIYRMKFEYYGATGATAAASAVITAATGSGGADNERDERKAVRRIKSKVIGMADRPDFNYEDPWAYRAAFADMRSTLRANYHKFALEETILATNLGIIGRKHNTVPPLVLTAPASITACTGHCRYFHITWPASTATGITDYSVRITAPAQTPYGVFDSGDLAVIGAREYVFKDEDTTGSRVYTFKVAAASNGIVGTYGTPVSLASAEDPNAANLPAAPGSVIPTAAGNAMSISWGAVTANTQALSGSTFCNSAGSVSGGSPAPSPWDMGTSNNRLVDLASYKVYRIRNYGVSANANFTQTESPAVTYPNRVDNLSIGTALVNTPPGSSTSFIDRTAAPCSTYFYRVEACDLCDKKNISTGIAAAGPPDPGEAPDVPGGVANAAYAVTGTTTVQGNDYVTVLNWPAVTRTVSGRPAATAHYKIERWRKVDPATEYSYPLPQLPIDVYENPAAPSGTGVASLTYTDSAPTKVMGRPTTYQYYVRASYTGSCNRESAPAGPYTASCAAANPITITTPAANTEISIPFENGFTPQVTVQNSSDLTAANLITKATATITGPGSDATVRWSSSIEAAGPTFTFAPFDNAPSLGTGTFTFNVFAEVDGCLTSTYTRTFLLGDATCGLAATNIVLTPTTGNPKFYQLGFNVQNTCDPNQGGLNFTVTGMRLTYSGYGGTRTVKEVRLANADSGTLITSTPVGAASGVPFTFLSGSSQIINAGQTSATRWWVIFSGEMKQNDGNATTFTSIIANTTTPANANDEILAGSITP